MCKEQSNYDQNLAVFCGGTGGFTTLRGLVTLNNPEKITAIPGMWDSGGDSGKLRVDYGILPPGDYMRSLFGLMESEQQVQTAMELLNDRAEGSPLRNLLGLRAERKYHSIQSAIDHLRGLFRIRGKVIPSTTTDLVLHAETKHGKVYQGEGNIDQLAEDSNLDLEDELSRIYFDSKAEANKEAIETIRNAQKVVFAPGSPYTSIMPHFLVNGIAEAIMESNAKVIAVLNLMTTKGEDRHFKKASDWLAAFNHYLGNSTRMETGLPSRLEYLIVNENGEKGKERYIKEGQNPIILDEEECLRISPGLEIVKKTSCKI